MTEHQQGTSERKNIVLLSPFHGGSHRSWAEGYAAHSRHNVHLLTMPARFWKWRMHGAALTLAREFNALALDNNCHLILATDMMDLSTFIALCRKKIGNARITLYMHENQLTYPLRLSNHPAEYNRHYAFINISSMLVADRVFFATAFHRSACLGALHPFLKRFPEHNELQCIDEIDRKSEVLPVGIDLSDISANSASTSVKQTTFDKSPLILWNQRWEHDKNPDDFVAALRELKNDGIPFRLALCGERYKRAPDIFADAQTLFKNQLIHVGHASRDRYQEILRESDIVISTAHHEFFGISIIEAIAAGAVPLLPRRLSYPEVLPERFHKHCLYSDQQDLIDRLRFTVKHLPVKRQQIEGLANTMHRFSWDTLTNTYDLKLFC